MADLSPNIVFLIILLVFPLQILLSTENSSDIGFHFDRLRRSVSSFVSLFFGRVKPEEEKVEVSPKDPKEKYFASSRKPRNPRPPYIKYRVGDVVKHRLHGYRGVIVGWDERAIAPSSWIAKSHKNKLEWAELPNYAVIIDTRDRLIPQLAYVVEENLDLHEGYIIHPLVTRYFEHFDGRHFKSRPWHKRIYPHD